MIPKSGDAVSTTYNPSLLVDSTVEFRTKTAPPEPAAASHYQLETLKKELDNRDSTISELKTQLKSLQTIVDQLTKENNALKVTADDSQSVTSQNSTINPTENTSNGIEEKVLERGKSMDTEQITRENDDAAEVRHGVRSNQRPVSMFETREGPKNNWQVTKHQVLILLIVAFTSIDNSLI